MKRNAIVCNDIFDLIADIPDQSIDAIITDPPYGTTACSWDVVIPFAPMWAAFKRVIKPRGAIVMTASQPFTSALVMSNPGMFRYEWVWDKCMPVGFLNAQRKPLRRHENILVFGIQPPVYYPQMADGEPYKKPANKLTPVYGSFTPIARDYPTGERYPTSIIVQSNGYQQIKQHPTQKPVALWSYLIRTYTQPGELVLDPFCGSGTTAVACRATGRDYLCGDSSQEYVDMANRRLAQSDPLLDREIVPGLVQRSLFSEG